MTPMTLRIVVTAGAVLALWLAAHTVKGRLVKDELDFTLAFVEAVKQRWPSARVDVHSPLHLQVEMARSRAPEQVVLSDAYMQYRAEPSRLQDLVQEHLHGLEQARAGTRTPA